jgi:hypothetical protein
VYAWPEPPQSESHLWHPPDVSVDAIGGQVGLLTEHLLTEDG